MTKKEIFIGFAVGIIANILGTLAYILIFSEYKIDETLKIAREEGHLGSLLALGALLNLIAFFGFLKIKRDNRAKGVLIATMLCAIFILILKIF
ncbi:hypothetical protein [Robertkochia solimangrovi]|uniref:hypothetical protein n=1 Tax=Robertkochia solimangrovi TaxID=2213046 RepID=UPI0011800093|nr:hypothetical protein [Robertkochia solimangrovi]TRZ43243.1 hypothetical protein DMZ48_11180 [Robertkochia solimangrovi]